MSLKDIAILAILEATLGLTVGQLPGAADGALLMAALGGVLEAVLGADLLGGVLEAVVGAVPTARLAMEHKVLKKFSRLFLFFLASFLKAERAIPFFR